MGNAYSFKDVVASLSGPTGTVNLANGAAPSSEGIDINPTGDKNTMTIAADGIPQHSLHADNSGKIVVRLLKISPQNAMLMQMYDTQKSTSSIWGQNTITVSESQSGDYHKASLVAFTKKPAIKYAVEGEMYEWSFDCGKIDSILGTY